jgi:hypothetical protein
MSLNIKTQQGLDRINSVRVQFMATDGYDIIPLGTIKADSYIDNTNGSERPYSNWSCTDFIAVDSTMQYRFLGSMNYDPSGGGNTYNAEYNENKEFIRSFTMSSELTALSSETRYIRLSQRTPNMTAANNEIICKRTTT